MINFGSVTVTHGGTSLGKTFGGGSLQLTSRVKKKITSYGLEREEIITGASGIINFYEWPSTITITSDLELYDYGQVILENDKIKITLYRCKLLLAASFGEIGQNTQKPIKVNLHATPDGSGNVIKIED